MKVFHVNREEFKMKKDNRTETYKDVEKYWGSIIIFEESERYDRSYAHLMDVTGLVCHKLTKATFHLLTPHPNTQHIYERGLSSKEWDSLLRTFRKMTRKDSQRARSAIMSTEAMLLREEEKQDDAEELDHKCECENKCSKCGGPK